MHIFQKHPDPEENWTRKKNKNKNQDYCFSLQGSVTEENQGKIFTLFCKKQYIRLGWSIYSVKSMNKTAYD